MTSTSVLGSTSITLQFDLNRNIDAAAQDVQAAITAASRQLPTTLTTPPTYRKVNPADSPILILAAHSDTLPLTVVDDFADTVIAQRISQITGVAQVTIGGEQKPAIRVQVDPAKLQTRGLTFEEVRAVLGIANTNAAKGSINGAQQSFTIAANDQLTKAEQYNDVIIAYRNGAPIRVRDVGHAVAGPQDVNIAALNGSSPSVILLIFKQPGANVIDTVDKIKAAMPQLSSVIPPGLQLDTIVDRTQTIRASVLDVEFTLALTIGLVVLVILVFLLDLRATLIPAVTVPLALLGAVAMMYLLGFSLDNLSLMAMTIAVGFVVDDAIVVTENIYRHVETGMPATRAAIVGAGEIGFTVLSISISLVAVFIPLLLMGGIIGRLFREFALTVTAAIGVSVVICLTLTPMLCSRFLLPQHNKKHGRIYRTIEHGFDAMIGGYRVGARPGAAASGDDACGLPGCGRHDRRNVHRDPERLLPDPRHRLDPGPVRGGAGCLAAGDEAPAARASRCGRARSRRRGRGLLLRQRRRQHAQYRAIFHFAQATRRAQIDRDGGDQPAPAAIGQGAGRQSLPAALTGHHRRRAHLARPIPIHPAGREPRRAQHLGAEDARQAQDAA
jgi:multidrug efflux pump subunit AcrB